MRLFHFSHDPAIRRFEPRPVPSVSKRPPGAQWVDEAEVVWAIDEAHQAMYLFPRDCPRILIWQTPGTRDEDLGPWRGERTSRVIAHIEWAWLDRLKSGSICRYEMPSDPFEDLQDAGMWVSRRAVSPIGMEVVQDLAAALAALDVELRVMPTLAPLRGVWDTTLHASGIRLRNATDW